ncbi:MAG: UDP-N-acetylmuramate--L-alanine ligase [Chloroflexi bacterium]|nr:UDP-N-acetylmuramate--L-alanine ligase [Chloroflexota bacterium]
MNQGEPSSIHFVGIGGIGLSGLARLLHAWGWQVSGSDRQATSLTGQLSQEGIVVHIGHHSDNIGDAKLVVTSSAVSPQNVEIQAATRKGIPVMKRDKLLHRITRGKRCVAVAGTHGKTTTTALAGLCLTRAGKDPTVIVGGIVPAWQSNVRIGHSDLVVVEADEYDYAFLGLTPEVAIITTIEMDHPDIYANIGEVTAAFGTFLGQVAAQGLVIAHAPDAEVDVALQNAPQTATCWRYGTGGGTTWQASNIAQNGRGGSDFDVSFQGQELGRFSLGAPGRHNVHNALAALAATQWLTAQTENAAPALAQFTGVERRLQRLGMAQDILVMDDYAHHPTEVRATLDALRKQSPERPLWAIFQPHTYSRTRALFDQFAGCFGDADHVLVTDIYAARETDNGSIDAQMLATAMNHPDARYTGSLQQTLARIQDEVRSGATVITLGAGDVTLLGPRLLACLKEGEK